MCAGGEPFFSAKAERKTNSTTRAMTVASAAPRTPMRGNPHRPKMSSKLKMALTVSATKLMSMGRRELPMERSAEESRKVKPVMT